jgi:hypothetical protein
VRRRLDDLVEYASDLRYARRYRREDALAREQALAPEVELRLRQEAAASEWPASVIPGALPWALVLGRSEDTVVWVHHFAAYPTGLMFHLEVRLRPGTQRRHTQQHDPDAFPLDETLLGLRYGLQVSTGETAVRQLGNWRRGSGQTGSLNLRPMNMHGSDSVYNESQWLHPLPPTGSLSLAAVWPERDIGETVVTVDAGEAHAAAERAIEAWPKPTAPTNEP